MKTRRDFVKLAAGASLMMAGGGKALQAFPATPGAGGNPMPDRARWCEIARRLAAPVLIATLGEGARREEPSDSLAVLGGLLHGLAPWLQRPSGAEQAQCAELASAARNRIAAVMHVMAAAPGRRVLLMDLALLAQALLRAPDALWHRLDDASQAEIILRFKHVRTLEPRSNHDRLFAVMTELALERFGEARDNSRFYEGLRRQQDWDASEGLETEGPHFHWESPHALVVQSMLVEALELVSAAEPTWASLRAKVSGRFRGMAELEERLIAPDGSFPSFGCAVSYRCGIFQGLALAAWRGNLPDGIAPSQARSALTAVIRRSLEDAAAYDHLGSLRAPLERELVRRTPARLRSKLYLCSAAFFPLALPATDPFWAEPAGELTWQRTWPAYPASV